ncbi:MAG: hypothetical protein ACTSP9_03115 [Promethearchaeota archaeon]
MKLEVKEYIEKNVNFYEPVFHVFDVEIDEKDEPDTGDYQTENDIMREPYWYDNKTNCKFNNWDKLVEFVEEKCL